MPNCNRLFPHCLLNSLSYPAVSGAVSLFYSVSMGISIIDG
jgi:hypothetical protein